MMETQFTFNVVQIWRNHISCGALIKNKNGQEVLTADLYNKYYIQWVRLLRRTVR